MARRALPMVLAVDDHPMNLELLREYLAGTESDLLVAEDGVTALEIVDRERPDLVLLDVVMPRLDGIEVCRRIKADPANRLVPVVLVTSLNTVEDRVRALEAGADDYLTKPVDRRELMARVLTLIRTKELYDRLDDAEHVMAAFARLVEAKDGGTQAHVERVARSARALAEAAGLEAAETEIVYFGGIVHDIGKVGVPDAVLLKPGPLTGVETEVMRRHVIIGVEIALKLKSAKGLVPIIRHHHERFDGAGYPDSLAGPAIPPAAMIVSICDAYDAMTSDRPYRPAMRSDQAVAELRNGSGSQWDPRLVDLFLGRVMQEPLASGQRALRR
ncbi:MAG TPA: HD domain-containing phosphohydrolase [Candidatus Dormibacteraeota bacterium]|nr:HD domain-containing phosphohydrolase [Candidatus Dormibacteraeota bacterium]HEV2477070.1 HD domain-containing phosphohydrolase [Candidatus Dormibacteraeota bacterium]